MDGENKKLEERAPKELLAENKELGVKAKIILKPFICYALQQNGDRFIYRVQLNNEKETDLSNLVLKISTIPEFTMPFSREVAVLPANEELLITDLKVLLNPQRLAAQTEKNKCVLSISLYQNDSEIFRIQNELDVLAFDEWPGIYAPDLVASFVTPNNARIPEIAGDAAKLMEKWTNDSALDGYQSKDPNRILAMAAAIYGAIQKQNILYSEPPASFVGIGQRVRSCDAMLLQKFGTCIEMALLYASVAESIGLHPIIVILKGHAFAGLWLEEESAFSDTIIDDPAIISKRTAEGINEIVCLECTGMNSGRNTEFKDAVKLANAKLSMVDDFICAVDINRARKMGILPLPQRVIIGGEYQVPTELLKESELTSAPDKLSQKIEVKHLNYDEVKPQGKVEFWERKLLDLGLRNSLINMRIKGNVIPLLLKQIAELEDALSSGKEYVVSPRPIEMEVKDEEEKNPEFYANVSDLNNIFKLDFENKRLRSGLSEAELSKNLIGLYRSNKVAIEEGGANTLFLTLGLLRWYETDRSNQARYAPIVLVPIDIVRKSANSGYIIRERDEDAQMNITLLEMLKQDFGIVINGLDPLPADEHGVDLPVVFATVRNAVMGQKRWDIIQSAYIGVFSFSQFVMWNDVRNRIEELEKNKIVKSLIDGKLAWDPEPMEEGEKVSEDEALITIPADASQLFAIETAAKGESFVLHGPPGTGKSQTITALIANALGQGKTVLFVAEKMAALSVVQKRLSKIGLGPFCLELHSNKSKKSDVIGQLKMVSEITKDKSPEEYERSAEQLKELRKELETYSDAVKLKRKCGLSVYELIDEYEKYAKVTPDFEFNPDMLKEIDAVKLSENELIVERLVSAADKIGHPHNHPLSAVRVNEYTQGINLTALDQLEAYGKELSELRNISSTYCKKIEKPEPVTRKDHSNLLNVCEELVKWRSLPAGIFKNADIQSTLYSLKDMCAHYVKAASYKNAVLVKWKEEVLNLDPLEIKTKVNAVAAKWAIPRFFAEKSMWKQYAPYAKDATKEDLLKLSEDLTVYQNEKEEGDALIKKCQEISGNAAVREFAESKVGHYLEAENFITALLQSRGSVATLFGNDNIIAMACDDHSLIDEAAEVKNAYTKHIEKKADIYDTLKLSECGDNDDFIAAEINKCDKIKNHIKELKDFIAYNTVKAEAENKGLTELVNALSNNSDPQMQIEEIMPLYKRAMYKGLINLYVNEDSVLNHFNGSVFNEKIVQLKGLDDKIQKLNQKEIFARLSSNVPDFTREAAKSSEAGILQRAIRNNSRGVSLRKLFSELPTLLPKLCPCMLMSPISAAQYLDPKREPFDLVVFDEASQLPTYKAVGAIARGKNAVIVGDPNQMPPTSFFMTNAVSEEEADTDDLESILDDCLALSMPQSHLLWHYRSRSESLIAFSNRMFYENRLFTFPSSSDMDSKVSFVKVNGVFDKGRSRTNKAEAEAVVREVVNRSKNPALKGRSVGIVTFNISQQNLIDDMLTERCKSDAELENWMNNVPEPLFIKNLENVQGDERDVILFSVSYGPDKDGKISMNFGPLNREGGGRRLNVAVSRSRMEMKVFSSMNPEDIDISRTMAQGAMQLRAFLEYAKKGKLPVTENGIATEKIESGGIAHEIEAFLEENGFKCDKMVGHSKFRVDVGVVDPADPHTYLLGILLDSDTYQSAKTVHDRELSHKSVLAGLGWNVYRIWSMDWWDDKEGELEKLLAELNRLKEENEERRALEAEGGFVTLDGANADSFLVKGEAAGAESNEALFGDTKSDGALKNSLSSELLKESLNKSDLLEESLNESDLLEESLNESGLIRGNSINEPLRKYKALIIETGENLSADEFTAKENVDKVKMVMLKFIGAEAPISRELLFHKTATAFGVVRLTKKVNDFLEMVVISLDAEYNMTGENDFFWAKGQEPSEYSIFRVNAEEPNKRDALDICKEEASNAVLEVMKLNIGLSKNDLIRETGKLFGFARVSSSVNEMAIMGIEYAKNKGLITENESGYITIV